MRGNLSERLTDKLNIFILSALYGASWLLIINDEIFKNSTMRYMIIFMSIFYFFLSYLKLNVSRNGKIRVSFKVFSWSIIILWVLFSIVVIISELYNYRVPNKGIFYLIIVIPFFIIIIPSTLNNPVKDIVTASFISSFIYLIISILYEWPTITYTYYGIFTNPNSLGQIAIVSTMSSVFILKAKYKDKRKTSTILYSTSTMMSLFMVIISKSRTALLTLTIMFSISGLLLIIKNRRNIIIKKRSVFRFSIVFILFMLIYFNFMHNILVEGIINKFYYQLGKGDILSSRQITWETVISEASLLGHGEDYFSSQFSISAHNSFFDVIGKYGVITGTILINLFISTLYHGVIYYERNKYRTYSMFPFIFTLMYINLSFGEALFANIGKGINVIMFNVFGLIALTFTHKDKRIREHGRSIG